MSTEHSLFGESNKSSASQNMPIVWRFITVFTKACHLSVFWEKLSQPMAPDRVNLRPISILSFHLHLVFPSRVSLSSFPSKSCMHFPSLPYVPYAPPFDASRQSIKYLVRRTNHYVFIMQFSPVSSLVGCNIFFSTQSSNICCLCSFLKERNHVSHP